MPSLIISKNTGIISTDNITFLSSLIGVTNKNPSHIAEMMIQGSTMGIIDITKNLKEYADADKDISALANRLLKFEQQNIEEMKKFL
jgi:hypothetical protein